MDHSKKIEERVREESWQSEGESLYEDNIICPYCGYVEEDSYEYAEGEHNEVECPECGRKYDVLVETKREFSTCRSICEMPEDFAMDEEG